MGRDKVGLPTLDAAVQAGMNCCLCKEILYLFYKTFLDNSEKTEENILHVDHYPADDCRASIQQHSGKRGGPVEDAGIRQS